MEVAEGEIPEETAGPYPGDGSNGPNALTESGVVRQDITSSFGSASGRRRGRAADGRPARSTTSTARTRRRSPGAAIYLWHCDRGGNYSMYDGDAVEENYLRGVQEADADGRLSFTTIVPGLLRRALAAHALRGLRVARLRHQRVGQARARRSSRCPRTCATTVYATEGYEQSVANLAQVSLDSDGIFSDGYSLQMATVTGSVEEGYVATLNVPV